MATVNIPHVGSVREAIQRQENRKREITSPDPVERYRRKNERIQDAAEEYFGGLVREAQKNRITAKELQGIDI